jgi:2-keto-4-pentenoate hydratase/2-oxohepta-3-ene-1,7-dioic acid hydratase in catechol pathway
MKIVLFDDYKLGLLKDGGVVDASAAVTGVQARFGQEVIEEVIESWERLKPKLDTILSNGPVIPLDRVRLRAPTPRPATIFNMGGNYLENGQIQRGIAWGFLKSAATILDPEGTVVLPKVDANIFHHEAELVVVVGKRGQEISQADAMDYVFGYTCGVDVSARLGSAAGPGGMLGKTYEGFAPIGPCIVTKDEVPDPHKLQVRLWVDGQPRHDYSTSDMARYIPECLEWISTIVALRPGDLVFTGTNHQGIGPIQDGETVEIEIQPIGRLRFHVSDPLKRRWPKAIDEQSAKDVRERTGGPGQRARPL